MRGASVQHNSWWQKELKWNMNLRGCLRQRIFRRESSIYFTNTTRSRYFAHTIRNSLVGKVGLMWFAWECLGSKILQSKVEWKLRYCRGIKASLTDLFRFISGEELNASPWCSYYLSLQGSTHMNQTRHGDDSVRVPTMQLHWRQYQCGSNVLTSPVHGTSVPGSDRLEMIPTSAVGRERFELQKQNWRYMIVSQHNR